jgi:hypothetical protein
MDQRTGHSQWQIDERRAAMTEILERVEARVQETVDGSKAAADEMLEGVRGTVHETVERVQPAADLLEHMQQSLWLLLGGAILVGYLLDRLARGSASPH